MSRYRPTKIGNPGTCPNIGRHGAWVLGSWYPGLGTRYRIDEGQQCEGRLTLAELRSTCTIEDTYAKPGCCFRICVQRRPREHRTHKSPCESLEAEFEALSNQRYCCIVRHVHMYRMYLVSCHVCALKAFTFPLSNSRFYAGLRR